MTTSPRIKERIYEETDKLIKSMEHNDSTIRMDFKDFEDFKKYFSDFIGSEEFFSSVDDKDLEYLFQKNKIQSRIDSNVENEGVKDAERTLLRENPELIRRPEELLILAEKQFKKQRSQEKRALRERTVQDLGGRVVKGVSIKKQVETFGNLELVRIRQSSREGGRVYERAKPRTWDVGKFKERFFIRNQNIPTKDLVSLYRKTYPDDPRTASSIYYKKYRLLRKQ